MCSGIRKKAIIHVYYGTGGMAGYYINSTLAALRAYKEECNTNEFDIYAFTNYYYDFSDEEIYKSFFRLSEKMKRNAFRKAIKLIEMYVNFSSVERKILSISKEYDDVYVVYSLNECYRAAYDFLKKVGRVSNVHLGIVVHDVVPFAKDRSNIIFEKQKNFLELAEFFVTHNKYSKEIIKQQFPHASILNYRMPLTNYDQFKIKRSKVERSEKITFLMLGYMRPEKGLDILLEAWKKVEKNYYKEHDEDFPAKLVIAGKMPEGVSYNFDSIKNVEIHDGFISDVQYLQFIETSDYGVFPYVKGTNSGVLSNIASLGKPAIVSDLPMFKESDFAIDSLVFKQGDYEDLANLISFEILNYSKQYTEYVEYMEKRVEDYTSKFFEECKYSYQELIK